MAAAGEVAAPTLAWLPGKNVLFELIVTPEAAKLDAKFPGNAFPVPPTLLAPAAGVMVTPEFERPAKI